MNAFILSRPAGLHLPTLFTTALLVSLSACTTTSGDLQRPRPAGAAVSDSAAKKNAPSAPQPSALDAQLTGLNNQIEGRNTYNAKLREVVAAKEQQLASVLTADRSAGPSVQEFELRTSIQSKLNEIDRAARSWQETIDAHQAVLKGAAADPRGPELATEIDRLVAERNELLGLRAQLVAITEKLPK